MCFFNRSADIYVKDEQSERGIVYAQVCKRKVYECKVPGWSASLHGPRSRRKKSMSFAFNLLMLGLDIKSDDIRTFLSQKSFIFLF